MVLTTSVFALYAAALAAANPIARREVAELNPGATEEAHQRDDTATRAFSNVQIKTSDGQCLFVDKLSGDFRANLTPVQVAACGSTDGQGWDVITAGKHNDQAGQMLVVSTLTQACFNVDPRRPAGNQVLLFSCGGRADGGGAVTNSQLFAFEGGQGPLSFQPQNSAGQCLAVNGKQLDIVSCANGAAAQEFTFVAGGGDGNRQPPAASSTNGNVRNPGQSATVVTSIVPGGGAPTNAPGAQPTTTGRSRCSTTLRTVRTTTRRHNPGQTTCTKSGGAGAPPAPSSTSVGGAIPSNAAPPSVAPPSVTTSVAPPQASTTSAGGVPVITTRVETLPGGEIPVITTRIVTGPPGLATANPTEAVPVSRAGGTLNPESAAEANQFDDTADRVKESVNIRAPDGRCFSVDPTAGDFRQNLIPVQLDECRDTLNQKFDVITAGKHNNGDAGRALLMSVMTNGCISFDGRRQAGDTVTVFSCGGRAAGEGETDNAQLYPFDGTSNIILEPLSGNSQTCLVAGNDRLESAACDNGPEQVFQLVEVVV